MKKKNLLNYRYGIAFVFVLATLAWACSNDDSNDLEACGCNFYPEINQYLPEPLSADDVIGEDTYYSGEDLRALNRECLERCR
ncbi:hypothetical protein [Robertkochia flava]|uniref:hypothetical protein n=1 Tax=Robertkochia flava TaxID=3447986 RepID=UPI001CCA338A|nr:hypothetical protein [Robertkochia marina]